METIYIFVNCNVLGPPSNAIDGKIDNKYAHASDETPLLFFKLKEP